MIFAVYVLLVWSRISAADATMEIKLRLLWLLSPCLLFPFWWLCRLFVTIPDREVRSQNRITLLHSYLRPRLTFQLISGGAPVEFPVGEAHKTAGGDIVSNISGHESFICGAVKNDSSKDAYIVEARFSELVGNNGQRMRDPIPLYWAPIGSLAESAKIPAQGERTLQLFRVTSNGLYFSHTKTPIDYLNFFEGGTSFAGKIVVEEIYHCSLVIEFTLELNGAPKLSITRVGGDLHRTNEEWEEQLAQQTALA